MCQEVPILVQDFTINHGKSTLMEVISKKNYIQQAVLEDYIQVKVCLDLMPDVEQLWMYISNKGFVVEGKIPQIFEPNNDLQGITQGRQVILFFPGKLEIFNGNLSVMICHEISSAFSMEPK